MDTFVAPAAARAQLWRTAVGLVVALIVYAVVAFAVLVAGALLVSDQNPLDWLVSVDFSTPSQALILLATFIGMALGPAAVVRLIHRRPVGSLFGRGARVIRDFAIAAAILLVVSAPFSVAAALSFPPVLNLPPLTWLALLPLTIAGLMVQTLAEELVFRGYLLQQLGARFRSAVAWMVFPSLLFAVLHYDPDMSGLTAVATLGLITLFALVAADLTARTGSIGAAWGFHFANNAVALGLVSVNGTITGLGLWRTTWHAHDPGLPVWLFAADGAAVLLGWIACRRALTR